MVHLSVKCLKNIMDLHAGERAGYEMVSALSDRLEFQSV